MSTVYMLKLSRIQELARKVSSPAASCALALANPLEELGKSAPTEVASLKLKDEPDKAATVYERDDGVRRSQQAGATIDAVLKVARALASKLAEALDDAAVIRHPLVVLLSQGVWANRVSVLAAIRYALESAAPATAARMKDRQAFRDFDDWRTLWEKFEELGEIPKPVMPPPAKPKFNILGLGWTEDEFSASAAAGPTGQLAQRLQESVDPALDLVALRGISRERVQSRVRPFRPGGGGGSGTKKRVPDEYLRMLGAVGEHFVYQQIKVLFPDFDVTNWRSRAKEVFGYGEGDDSLGYDFEYHDVDGKLTGKLAPPRCLIEVKSAAQDCGHSFEMTTNEWETAIQSHNSESAVYLIIRVAGTALQPHLVDILVDPVDLHLQGVLDYSSRDLLVAVGRPVS